MILTILGVNGPFPSAGGACSGYLLSSDSGRTNLLIECGSGVLSRLTQVMDIRDLDAVVLSHLHYDHMSDMLPMNYLIDFSGRAPVKTVCPENPKKAYHMLSDGKLDLYPVRDMELKEMKLEFMPGKHPVESYALRVVCDGQTFVYTGDTNWVDELVLFASQADLLLADAGLLSCDWTEKKPHMSARLCARLAREASAKQLVLTHLSPLYDPEALIDEALVEYPKAILARAGMRISV